jgi:hypothetical protein
MHHLCLAKATECSIVAKLLLLVDCYKETVIIAI